MKSEFGIRKKRLKTNCSAAEQRTAACDEPFGREFRVERLKVERLSRVKFRRIGKKGIVYMKKITDRVKDLARCYGAGEVGIITTEMLEGGPPCTDLTYVLPNAKSAVSFGVPLDQNHIASISGGAMRRRVFRVVRECSYPDKEIRQKRYKMLTENGVIVENTAGSREAVSPAEAKKRLAAMDPETRALYEEV